MEDEKVTSLPVRFKGPAPKERSVVMLHEIQRTECDHLFRQYIVSQAAAEVECGGCGAKLNPMWVLMQLASQDRRMAEAAGRYQDEMKRLGDRHRAKCDHCGKMTRIRNK